VLPQDRAECTRSAMAGIVVLHAGRAANTDVTMEGSGTAGVRRKVVLLDRSASLSELGEKEFPVPRRLTPVVRPSSEVATTSAVDCDGDPGSGRANADNEGTEGSTPSAADDGP
jgi:hypothetical protein